MGLAFSGEAWGAVIIAAGFGVGASFGLGVALSRASAKMRWFAPKVPDGDGVSCAKDRTAQLISHLRPDADSAALAQAPGFDRPRHRRTVFAGMPPVAEVHEQARQIAKDEPVWSGPEMRDHLDQFMLKAGAVQERLISEYHRSDATPNDMVSRTNRQPMDDMLTLDSEDPYSRDISRLKLSA